MPPYHRHILSVPGVPHPARLPHNAVVVPLLRATVAIDRDVPPALTQQLREPDDRLTPAGLRSAHDAPDRKLMISFRNIMSQTLRYDFSSIIIELKSVLIFFLRT